MANNIRKGRIDGPDGKAINTFKWAKMNLALQAPNAIPEIRRHESDSKEDLKGLGAKAEGLDT